MPGYYLMTGAPRPPTAAWTSALASGVASRFDPATQLELGYFYSEFSGIHENYVRNLVFTEQEILPRLESGPSAFYDTGGKLQPQFKVQMDLLGRFSADLHRLTAEARRLRVKLEEQARDQGGVRNYAVSDCSPLPVGGLAILSATSTLLNALALLPRPRAAWYVSGVFAMLLFAMVSLATCL